MDSEDEDDEMLRAALAASAQGASLLRREATHLWARLCLALCAVR
jgi:hypothetical protein